MGEQIKTLSDYQSVELIVSETGNAVLYHKGPLPDSYIWAQYDQDTQIMQFISDDGQIKELGMPIHKPFREPLMKTREIFLVEVDANKNYINPQLIKFTSLVE